MNQSVRAILRALTSTASSVLVVTILRGSGLGADAAIQAGLTVAGAMTIFGLASLKGDSHMPRCNVAFGEPAP